MTTNTPAPAHEAVLTNDEIRSLWVEHGLDDEAAEDFARAIESALLSKLRAPVADEPCKRCGGPGWYTSHTTGYPESIPCSACNPQGVSVERLAKDPFLAAQLWRKPAEADGSLLERILEHVGEYGESMASSALLSVRSIARRNVETRIAAELASAPVADERAAFEAWANNDTPESANLPISRNSLGDYEDERADGAWHGWSARARRAALASASVAQTYVEARECKECGHVGINDSSDTLAACTQCEWSGDSPADDHCPGCERDGTMTAACPKCGCQYSLLADRTLTAGPAASAPVAGEPTQKAAHDTYHAETEHERVTALAYWLDQQTFEPGMLSIAAATLRAMLSRDAAPQPSATIKQSLNVAPQVSEAVRDAALEEAAVACKETSMMNVDSYCGATASMCADRIRALKNRAALSAQPGANK